MRLNKKFLLLNVILLILINQNIYSQSKYNGKVNKSVISGKIIDSKTNEIMQYVSVAVLKAKDSTLVNGGITNEKGEFAINNISYGKYILKCSFVGYKDSFKNVAVNDAKTNAGEIKITESSSNLETVNITADRQMMEYKLDKRVINVDKNLVASGGDASNVLDQVPSVQVDDEGNLTLRGNSNVTLLIDGKPSSLYGSDIQSVLSQIPASSIETIEVITNPSAKYNPEGMSGIINIKLKEKGNRGLNGNINITGGSALQKYMPKDNFSAALNYSNKKFAINASVDGRYDDRGRKYDNVKFLYGNTPNTISDMVRSQRDGSSTSYGMGFQLGADYYINKLNTLSLNFNTHLHNTPDDNGTVTNTDLLDINSSRTNKDISSGTDKGNFNNIGITYDKKFKGNSDQEFYANLTWNWGDFKNNNDETLDYYNNNFADYYKNDNENSHFNHLVADIHYVQPFSKTTKLEVGYNLEYNNSNNSYDYYINNNPFVDTATSYDFHRDGQIHALYATFGFQLGEKLSTQLGLRGEIVTNNFSKELLTNINTDFTKNYNSLYPTIHISYQLTKAQAFQLSYSRRVRRPDPWTLMPNIDLSNPEYVRFGNPNIDPEYTDAYELGYSLMLKKATIYSSLYYRKTSNEMERFEFLWNQANCSAYGFDWAWDIAGGESNSGRTAQTYVNLAHCYNYGLELIIDYQLFSWWKTNISSNFFAQEEDGSGLNYSNVKSFNWNTKLTSTMTLPKEWTIQLSGQYYAPTKTIQGRNEANYFADIAIRKNILHKQGTIALNFRDMFNTRAHDGYVYTDQYYAYNHRKPYSQAISVSFSYRFGQTTNMKKKVQKQQQDSNYNYTGGEEE